ncbi:hypothetical protein HY249_02570 [Candidatus Azambacteria bacterium]|nr:hypothetical protein [Candidatus Azambacteria bacterium]
MDWLEKLAREQYLQRRKAIGWFGKLAIGIGIPIGIIAIVSIVAAILTYFLWNWLMPEIFAIKAITFWQALGINFLAGILFKNSSFLKSFSRD